ncbi:MAG: CHAP domain-containing protein [Methylococcales bacterium]|nr:CHAP domain-containing protein [Methylococcales bacterium]
MFKKIIQTSVLVGVLSATTSVAVAGAFYAGYCTWGVAQVKGNGWLPWSGDAQDWCKTAQKAAKDMGKKADFSVNFKEKVGAIVVFPGWKANPLGHVGIITKSGVMKSMNDLDGKYNWTYNRAISGFPKKASPVKPSCYIYYNMNKI